MKINRSNYEIFFLDYFEGNLPQEQVAPLMSFLEKNPDLKEEFDSFEFIKLEDNSNNVFHNKFMLKVPETKLPITDKNFDWFCIASLEKDLSAEEEKALFHYIEKNPQKQRDLELFSKTLLKADQDVVFEKPQILKRFQATPFIITRQLWAYASAAAVVFIIAGLFFMMPKHKTELEMAIEDSQALKEIPAITSPNIIESENVKVADSGTENIQHYTVTQKTNLTSTQEKAESIDMPKPLLASQISVNHNIELTSNKTNNAVANLHSIYETSNIYSGQALAHNQQSSEEDTSLSFSQYASNRFQNATNIDLTAGLSRNKLSLWDFAGAGLARLSNLTGSPLTVQKERDENGKIIEFALGERFSISKR
jgi:hypothetical protein